MNELGLGPEYDPRGRTRSGKIGVFSVGLHTYWPQFPGLKERLLGHVETFEGRLREAGHEIVSAGMSDSSHRAFEIGSALRREEVDLVFCYVATYATASTTVIAAQRAGVPVVLVGLQPQARMDYAMATTELQLENDNVTSLPEIVGAMQRCGADPADAIVGMLHNDERAWGKVMDWAALTPVLHDLKNARIGSMGHIYEGMLDMNSDATMFTGAFGMHVEALELDDLAVRVAQVSDEDVAAKTEEIEGVFTFPEPGADPLAGPVSAEAMERAAKVSVGLDRMVEDFGLTGLAYYYRGLDGNENEQLASSMIVGNSLLTGRGVPVAGELDIKNCVAMLIMDRLGAGGSFAELHPVDFEGDFVLVGHDGPAHLAISGTRPVMRGLSLYHGKRGSGASVEFFIRPGPITLLGLTQTHDGRFRFVVAEGESLEGPIPATGNTNTRAKFAPDVASFIERWSLAGPTHHFALGTGRQAGRLEKLAEALDIEFIDVTDRASC